jgi:hypothetical protein
VAALVSHIEGRFDKDAARIARSLRQPAGTFRGARL